MQHSLQNPCNVYRLALAYQGNGNRDEARKSCLAAARFNALLPMNYAYIRQKAEKMLPAL